MAGVTVVNDIITGPPTESTAGALAADPQLGDVVPTRVTLGGVPIVFENNTVRWGYTGGVAPQQLRLVLPRNVANAVINAARATAAVQSQGQFFIDTFRQSLGVDPLQRGVPHNLDLTLAGPNANGTAFDITFRNLSLLYAEPVAGGRPPLDSIVVSDDRWRWSRRGVTRRYNMIRKANDRYVYSGRSVAAESLLSSPRYFQDWSMYREGGTGTPRPWTTAEIVRDILVSDLGYGADDVEIQQGTPTEFVPQNVVLDGVPADTAIAQMLTMGNNSLYIDNDGKVILYSTAVTDIRSRLGRVIDEAQSPQISGAIDFMDKRLIRPSNVEVFFQTEEECLFTYVEATGGRSIPTGGADAPATTSAAALAQVAARRVIVENVTCTCYDNQVPGLPRGVFVPIARALAQFRKTDGSPVTLDDIRQWYGIAANGISVIQALASSDDALDPNKVLAWHNIISDYRTLFRIPDVVMATFGDIQPFMAAVLQPLDGLRAPSEVYSTIAWIPVSIPRDQTKRVQGSVLDSFSTSPYTPVPLGVSIVDKDLGVYRVTPLSNVRNPGYPQDVIMGRSLDDSYYQDVWVSTGTRLNSRNMLLGPAGLDPNWQCSVVMSVTPQVPNTPARLYREDVPPPAGVQRGDGPPVQTYCGLDTYRTAIDPSGPLALYANQTYANGEAMNRRIIEALARTEAYRVWLSYADQPVGAMQAAVTGASANIRPTSWLDRVAFVVNADGSLLFELGASPRYLPPDVRNLLQADILTSVFRQVGYKNAPNGQRTDGGA